MSKIVRHLKVIIVDSDWGIWLDHNTGAVCVGARYLTSAKINCLYLDVIHVLVHVKQFLDGKDLFDQTFEYVDRPTEIEAYRYTVDEAKRLQMTEDEILQLPEGGCGGRLRARRLIEKIGVKAPAVGDHRRSLKKGSSQKRTLNEIRRGSEEGVHGDRDALPPARSSGRSP